MRIGIFGGTFDPVHLGHLILAEQAREQGELDEVWFVPAPRPPQKDGRAITRFDVRVEMLELAIAGNPSFRVDPLEKDRTGPSYTVDTLIELHRRAPEHTYALIVGSDALADLPLWRDPRGIVSRAELLVMARPGSPRIGEADLRQSLALTGADELRMRVVDAPLIDIASRDIRRRVAAGRSVRYLLPRAIEVFVGERRLYQTG
jgi:nicotinate-nucleotide adenylyltransferase